MAAIQIDEEKNLGIEHAEGYDVVLVGSMFGQPAFRKKYGNYCPDLKEYQFSGPWQVALGYSGNIGAILGCVANGYFVQIFGTDGSSWCRCS
jgi:SP family general alpha glucoside:H+ symporter-like MFS transporter